MFIAIMTVSLIALLLDVKYKHSFVLLGLNIAGGTASTLGIIAIIKYRFSASMENHMCHSPLVLYYGF